MRGGRTTAILGPLAGLLTCFGVTDVTAQAHCDDRVTAAEARSAAWAGALATRVTIRSEGAPLRDLLDQLSRQAAVRFSYAAETLPLDSSICIALEDAPLGAALGQLLAGLSITPVLVDLDHIVLTPAREIVPGVAGETADGPPAPRPAEVIPLQGVVATGKPADESDPHLPYARDVVDGELVAGRSTGDLANRLEAAVPGLWAWGRSADDGRVRYGSLRGASSFGAAHPKVYIDGIEVADPLLLADLIPEAVERIEAIRGPQGGALYGADALSGVVNVVTRRGEMNRLRPSVSVRGGFGLVATDFATGSALRQDHVVTVQGGSARASGMLNLGVASDGEYVPGGSSRRFDLAASGRLLRELGVVTTTLRVHAGRAGSGWSPPTKPGEETVQNDPLPVAGDGQRSALQYTLGTSMETVESAGWVHRLGVGIDGYRQAPREAGKRSVRPISYFQGAAGGAADRASLRGSSVRRFAPIEDAAGTFTFFAEHSLLREASSVGGGDPVRLAAWSPVTPGEPRWQSSWGFGSHTTIGYRDALYLSTGLRLERTEGFPGFPSYSLLPMLGASIVTDLGPASLKLRSAYGKGIRPAGTALREALATGRTPVLSTPIGPEVQSGIELGLDITIGGEVVLGLTRFDQVASGLIQPVAFAQPPGPGGTARSSLVYALQNVGEVTNRGWEAEGSLGQGPFGVSMTLATVDSRVRALSPGYSGDLRRGDRMLEVPARTGSVRASWAGERVSASVTASRAWSWIGYDRVALAAEPLRPRTGPGSLTGSGLRAYWREYDGVGHIDAALGIGLRQGIDLLIRADNLLDRQVGEPDNLTIMPGRTFGVQVSASF